jgi:hypothetical protein
MIKGPKRSAQRPAKGPRIEKPDPVSEEMKERVRKEAPGKMSL